MKPIMIQPGSALAGAAVLALVFLATGAAQVGATGLGHFTGPTAQVEITNPSDFVSGLIPQNASILRENDPLLVPPGSSVGVTALGRATAGVPRIPLRIEGVSEVVVRMEEAAGKPLMRALPQGLVVPASSTVSVHGGGGEARAWGYLVDA